MKNIGAMTQEEIKILHDYLTIVIKNSHKCQHCVLNNSNLCFFAIDCIAKDFHFYEEED